MLQLLKGPLHLTPRNFTHLTTTLLQQNPSPRIRLLLQTQIGTRIIIRNPSTTTTMPPTKPLPTDLPIHAFASAPEFETFLEKNHTTAGGVYLKLAKKSSGIASITASEAVEVALCFGWIDGRANGLDEKFWLVRYTPRRAKSLWSAKNVGTVARLVEAGRMRRAGLEAVEAAKRDGRWERAYDGPANIEVPADLDEALGANGRAKEVFEGLNRTDRYSVLHRLQTGAVSKRVNKIEAVVDMLSRGEVSMLRNNGKGKEKKENGLKAFKVEKKVKTKKPSVETASAKVSKRVETSLSSSEGIRQLRSRKPRQ